jgi:predicted ATPase/DNA-binding CsgD family transcriptional regulator/transcriptional regulator with XRE-family HTH domain
VVLRALREMRGITREGWAARLGYSASTVQRWERGESAPDAAAEVALLALLAEERLLRPYTAGPLAGLSVTAELVREALAGARLRDRAQAEEPVGAPAVTALRRALPLAPTPLIGRQALLAAAAARLRQPASRLLTCTGPPGVGKTRLALAVAERLTDGFEQTAFVDLSPLADPARVLDAVALQLEIREGQGRSAAARLAEAIGRRRMLLILDNFEHLLAAAPLVADLLSACAGLAILATSRAPLHLRWEQCLPVPPLAPAAARTLFAARARAVSPDFALTEQNTPLVAAICAQLDHLPLAIELAAARVATLPLPDLAQRLDRSHDPGAAGLSDLPPRQRTLHAALTWSYDLLGLTEQRLLRWLAVFAGDISAADVLSVCADGPDAHAGVAAGLAMLVDGNLIRYATDRDGQARLRMLETARAYARERLDAAGESRLAQQRHAQHFLALAREAEPWLKHGQREPWMRRLDQSLDNIRGALAWCASEPDAVTLGLQLGAALDMYWHFRDHWREAQGWLERLLAAAGPDVPAETRARALCVAGRLAVFLADRPAAEARLADCLALAEATQDAECRAYALMWRSRLAGGRGGHQQAYDAAAAAVAAFRRIDDPWGLALALWYQAQPAAALGDDEGALAALDEGLRGFRDLGDEWGMALIYELLLRVLRQRGDVQGARRAGEASVALRRRAGVRFALASSLLLMARVYLQSGDEAAATAAYDETEVLYRELGLPASLATTLRRHAYLELRRGDATGALGRLQESLRLDVAQGDETTLALALGGLARVAAALSDRRLALHLAAVARGLIARAGVGSNAVEWNDDVARIIEGLAIEPDDERAGLGGMELSDLIVQQAIDAALAIAPPADAPVPLKVQAPTQPRSRPLAGLTAREVEVIGLIAAGVSNREIAEKLSISVRTVEKHIARLYDKIEARGRADATAYAIRQGLAPRD